MSEHKRDKTKLHKEISSIFKEIPIPQTEEGQRPSGSPAPERTDYTKPKSSAPEQQKYQSPKVNQSPQSLPKAAPVSQSKASSVKQPKTAPVSQSKAVPAKHNIVVPIKQHKAMSAKKQKTFHIQYLKTLGVIWATCFVVFLFANLFVLGPQKKNKKRIENEFAEKKKVYESALRAAQKETKIQLNEQIERLQTRMKDFVVDFDDSASLTFEISQIADDKKVSSFSIKGKKNLVRSGEPDCKYISKNHIIISFIGKFNQFATFLNDLERHRPVLLVDKFTVSRSGQDYSAFRVSLNVAAFVRKQQDDKTTDKRLDQVYGMKI